MPTIIIEVLEGYEEAQKAELAKAITDDVVRILGARPEGVSIIYHDLPRQNFAKSGVLYTRK